MMEETAILTGLQRMDVKAFDAVYDRLFPHILLYIEKITKNEKEAEDIAIDAFARMWERLNERLISFDKYAQVRSFLFTTAKNSAISYLRNQKAQRNYTNFLVYLNQAEEEAAIDRYSYEAGLWEKLFDAINNLPDKCQEVFKLRYYSGMSRSEVAEQLNLSKKTVDNHCKTAIDKLRLLFTEKELLLFFMLLSGFCEN